MNIDNLTIGEARAVAAMFSAQQPGACNGACKEFQHLTASSGARQAEPQEVAA